MKILIADHDEAALSSLSYALLCNEMEVTACQKFDQAVDALVGTEYDLFIVAIDMPGARISKGIELLGFIKRHFCARVIVLSLIWRESESEMCQLHELHYMVKPTNVEEVLRSV